MPVKKWKIESHYLPSVVTLDAARKNADQFIFKKELQRSRMVMVADAVMKQPDYQGPDKETWEMYTSLIGARNHIARLLSIRDVNGLDADSGYTLDRSIDHRGSLPSVDITKLRVGKNFHRINESKVSDTHQANLLLPMVRAIDYVISKMEKLCWEEVYPKFNNRIVTNSYLQKNSITPPELVRDGLHEVRRHLADFCVLPGRPRHDHAQNPQWILSVDGQYDLDPMDRIEQSKVEITT